MEEYYDFLLASTYPGNTPASWAHAIQLITDADALIDPVAEQAVQRRIDDLKQYWYCYYLQAAGDGAGMQAFVGRGQMSYMNAMYGVLENVYPTTTNPAVAAGPVISAGPAHYSAAQTAVWWAQVRAFWPV